jgi:hypothetical protein
VEHSDCAKDVNTRYLAPGVDAVLPKPPNLALLRAGQPLEHLFQLGAVCRLCRFA